MQSTVVTPARQTKINRLEKLQEICSQCANCDLRRGRQNLVFGDGSPDAKIVFLGEAPGRTEDLKGIPFIGRCGKELRFILNSLEFDRDIYYIANIIKCRPPSNRTPTSEEIKECIPFLKKQIEIIKPSLIVLLGRTAVNGLFPIYVGVSLETLRMDRTLSYKGIPVRVTYHPSAWLRRFGIYKSAVEDLGDVRLFLKGA